MRQRRRLAACVGLVARRADRRAGCVRTETDPVRDSGVARRRRASHRGWRSVVSGRAYAARGDERPRLITDSSFATVTLVAGVALALLGAGFGLWLILIGVGVGAARPRRGRARAARTRADAERTEHAVSVAAPDPRPAAGRLAARPRRARGLLRRRGGALRTAGVMPVSQTLAARRAARRSSPGCSC